MNKTTFIWIILFILTTITLYVGENKTFTFTLLILISTITIVKGQLVIDYFMGLKNVKTKYRMIITLWLFFVVTSIALLYK